MISIQSRLYFTHLRDVHMDYLNHMRHALRLTCLLFKGSVLTLFHAVFPFAFDTATTNTMKEIEMCMLKSKNT